MMKSLESQEFNERKSSFGSVWRPDAKLLILGSLPSDESLRMRRYYAHPRNAFWPIMSSLLGIDEALPYEGKLQQLMEHRVALWDIVASAHRPGSLDSSIRHAQANDIPGLIRRSPNLRAIGCNGTTAMKLLKRFFPDLPRQLPVVQLPSTSPAAAQWTRAQKEQAFRDFLSLML